MTLCHSLLCGGFLSPISKETSRFPTNLKIGVVLTTHRWAIYFASLDMKLALGLVVARNEQ